MQKECKANSTPGSLCFPKARSGVFARLRYCTNYKSHLQSSIRGSPALVLQLTATKLLSEDVEQTVSKPKITMLIKFINSHVAALDFKGIFRVRFIQILISVLLCRFVLLWAGFSPSLAQ